MAPRAEWRIESELQEQAFAKRQSRMQERRSRDTQTLGDLDIDRRSQCRIPAKEGRSAGGVNPERL